jgi:hypothetical protein
MKNIVYNINELICHPKIQEYIDLAYSIKRENDDPFLSYFGINYNGDEVVNFKVYFEFHNLLSKNDISKLLPDTDLFMEHYPKLYSRLGKIQDKNHSWVTFAIKITPEGKITYYFHFAIPEGKALRLPSKIKLTSEEEGFMNNIVSCEYTGSKKFIKHYYVIWNKETLKHLVNRFDVRGLEKFKSFSHIEYTETEKFDKVMIGIRDPKEQTLYMDGLPEGKMKKFINYLCKRYDLMTGSCSVYDDGKTRGVYFALQNDKIFYTSIDTIESLRDTIFKTGIEF